MNASPGSQQIREEKSSYDGLSFWEYIFDPNPKWTKSGCLLRGVDLDFPAGVNQGGYDYEVQSNSLE